MTLKIDNLGGSGGGGGGGGLTGLGAANSIALWTSGTNLSANIFFNRDPFTAIVQNTPGFQVNTTPTTTVRYVDSVAGSDLNTGLSAGVGNAWQTIQHAIEQQPLVAPGIYEINLANGTYAGFIFKDILGNAQSATYGNNVVRIVGDVATPSNVVIQSATNPVYIINGRSVLVLDGVTLDGDGTSNGGVFCFNGIFDLLNVNIQNCTIGIQMSEASRGRWLAGATGGNITATSTGVTIARGASFSIQRPLTVSGFTGFGFLVSSNALLGLTTGVTTLNIAADAAGGVSGIQVSTGGALSSSVGTFNISNMTSGGTGTAFRIINGGKGSLLSGTTINVTDCTRGGQITSGSYFQDGTAGNTWNYLGTTAAEWLVDSDALIFSPNTFNGAVIASGTQTGYVMGAWWNKQVTIAVDTTLDSQHYSVKCNHAIPIAVTLPLSSTVGVGRIYKIADISGNAVANNITLTPTGADTINGAASFPININYGSATAEAISGGWSVI